MLETPPLVQAARARASEAAARVLRQAGKRAWNGGREGGVMIGLVIVSGALRGAGSESTPHRPGGACRAAGRALLARQRLIFRLLKDSLPT